MANPNQPNLGQTQQDIRDIASMTEDTFRSVADNIQSMFRDALEAGSNVSRSLGNDISNNLKALARQSATALDNQEKLNRGVLKQSDIQKQIEARMSKINAIENQINAARMAGMDIGQEIVEDLENTKRLNDVYINQLKEQKDLLDGIDKEIGQLGTGIKGLGTFFGKLGFDGLAKPLENAINNTKAYKVQLILANREYEALINKSEELTDDEKERKQLLEDEIKALEKKQGRLKNIAASLKEEFTLTNMTDALVGKILQSFFKLDEAQTKFQNLTGGTVPIMDQVNSRLISSVDYIQTAASLTEQTGFNAAAIFSPDTLASAAEMVKSMGMTQEQANKAAIMSQINGKSVDSMNAAIKKGTQQHNATNRSAQSYGAVMREVYSTSTAIAASMGNNTAEITKAVIRAKDLGLSLQEVDNIASSLLDVEQSISKEFEYETISGKQINLEAARYYALTNQTAKLTEEIGKNQAIVNSFASGNRIEQEAAAAALGMNRDQLAEMYMAQQRNAKLTDEQIAKNMNMEVGDVRRLTVQESINTSIAKMTELLAGPLEMMASILTTAMKFSDVITAIVGTMVVYKGIQLVSLGIQKTQAAYAALQQGFAFAALSTESSRNVLISARQALLSGELAKSIGIAAAWAVANPFSAIAGLAVAAGVGALVYSQIKDGVVDPKKGPVMTGEFGSVQLDPKDKAMYGADGKIKVGTDLIKSTPSTSIRTPQQTVVQQSSPTINYDKMAQALSKVQVNTNIDGVKVSNQLFNKPAAGMAIRKI